MNDDILHKVKECIVDAVGVSYSEIDLHSQIVNDLGADSLDLVELVYQIETKFGISLQRGAIMERIKSVMPEEEFLDEEGFITPRGKEMIRKEVPELGALTFAEKMTFNAVVSYFTVEIFVNLIARALAVKGAPEGSV
jgi:acyl carrier protein